MSDQKKIEVLKELVISLEDKKYYFNNEIHLSIVTNTVEKIIIDREEFHYSY